MTSKLTVLLLLLGLNGAPLLPEPLPVDEVYPEAPPTRDERRLVEALAKTSFNEAGDSYADLAMLWQITAGHGETARERYQWLRRHSPCVNGILTQDQAYQRPGNCRWTRNLMPDGRRPRGWRREDDGPWSRMRARWLAHLERVRDFIYGRDTFRPCVETPESWDGRRWLDAVRARGWRDIECGETLNVGVVRR